MNAALWAMLHACLIAFLALIMLNALWHKLADFKRFAAVIPHYRGVPPALATAVVIGVVSAESVALAMLVLPMLSVFGAVLSGSLIFLYGMLIAVNVSLGNRQVDCGCGGKPQPLSWVLVVRNVALSGLALLAVAAPFTPLSLMALLGSIAMGFVAWVLYCAIDLLMANAERLRSSNAEVKASSNQYS